MQRVIAKRITSKFFLHCKAILKQLQKKDDFREMLKEIEYEVLFVFESDETERSYIVYTDNKKDKNDNTKVYASIYKENIVL